MQELVARLPSRGDHGRLAHEESGVVEPRRQIVEMAQWPERLKRLEELTVPGDKRKEGEGVDLPWLARLHGNSTCRQPVLRARAHECVGIVQPQLAGSSGVVPPAVPILANEQGCTQVAVGGSQQLASVGRGTTNKINQPPVHASRGGWWSQKRQSALVFQVTRCSLPHRCLGRSSVNPCRAPKMRAHRGIGWPILLRQERPTLAKKLKVSAAQRRQE